MSLVLTTLPDAGLALFTTEMIGAAVIEYVVRLLCEVYVDPAMLVVADTVAPLEIVAPSAAGLSIVTTSVSVAVEFAAIDPIV